MLFNLFCGVRFGWGWKVSSILRLSIETNLNEKYVRSETISIEISSFSLVDAPLDFVRKLADVEVGELPGVAVLECELNKPDIPVKWFRDNKPLAPGKKYKMMDEGTVHKLEITDVDGEDEGNYYVVAGGLKSDANVFVEGMHIMFFCFFVIICIKTFHSKGRK